MSSQQTCWKGMRFISHHEIERRLVHDGVRAVVVGKLCMGDLINPGTRVGPAEDPKVRFDLLVDTFCFTVGLGVIGGGEGEVIVEEFAKFLGESGGKLQAMIRDDFIIEPKVKIYFMEKEDGYPFDDDGFLGGAENYPLHKAIVDHDQ